MKIVNFPTKRKELRRISLSVGSTAFISPFFLPETDSGVGGGRDIDVATCQENVLTDDYRFTRNEGCFGVLLKYA